MQDFLNITILAILQGVSEFLPISSSGHLVILQHLMEVPESLRLKLEVYLHAGTLLSIFVFYWRTVWRIVAERDWRYVLKIVLSAMPAVAVYFAFKDDIEAMVSNARMVGALLMFTGAVLIGTRYLPRGEKPVTFLRAFAMGLGQALALLPGVSRSGMTIASARGGRVDAAAAAEFSFLMSAPLIMGGVALELLKSPAGGQEMSHGVLLWGTMLAAVVGYFSLALLLKALKGRWFWMFGPYCLAAGLLTLLFC